MDNLGIIISAIACLATIGGVVVAILALVVAIYYGNKQLKAGNKVTPLLYGIIVTSEKIVNHVSVSAQNTVPFLFAAENLQNRLKEILFIQISLYLSSCCILSCLFTTVMGVLMATPWLLFLLTFPTTFGLYSVVAYIVGRKSREIRLLSLINFALSLIPWLLVV